MLLFNYCTKIKLFEGSMSLRFRSGKPAVKLVRKHGLTVTVGCVALKRL